MTVRIHLRHLRALRLCSRGIRAWCERHGVDWPTFVRDGIAVEDVPAHDAFVNAARAVALQEASHGQ